jgi:hypothetical protein
MKHLDYGYCSTTYSAQGATVQTCIMNADSSRGERLLNRMGWYVGVSRPKTEFRVFTDDAEALRRAVARDPQKSIALEAIKPSGTGPQQNSKLRRNANLTTKAGAKIASFILLHEIDTGSGGRLNNQTSHKVLVNVETIQRIHQARITHEPAYRAYRICQVITPRRSAVGIR